MKLGKENLKKLGILVIILVVLKLGISGIQKILPHEYGCNSTNFVNGNWVVQKEEDYYFINTNIYKLDKKGTITLLKENSDNGEWYTKLNIVGEWIYYVESKTLGNADSIRKIKLDGSEDQEIASKEEIYSLFVIDNKIYFTTHDEGLISMSNTGTNRKVVYEEGTSDAIMAGQYLLKGESKNKSIKLVESTEARYWRYYSNYPQIEGDWFYVIEDMEPIGHKFYLRRMSRNGTEDKRIDENVTSYLVTDQYIYYGKEENEKVHLFRMNLDYSGKKVIMEGNFTNIWGINSTNDKLFFIATTNPERNNGKKYCVNIDGTNLQELPE